MAPAKKQLPASWHLASGAISGVASVLTLQPLDLIKTRVQQDQYTPQASTSKAHLGQQPPIPDKLKGKIWATTKAVVRKDGVRGLWRGTTPTLYRNVPGVSMYFLTLSKLRSVIGNSGHFVAKGATASPSGKIKLSTAGDLIVGSTARTGVGFILMPFTLLKTISESTLAAQGNTSSIAALRTLYSNGGIKSLWRGAIPTALRDAPGAGLFIVFYERGRRLLGVRGDAGGGAVGGGMAGASASLLSTLLTTPFDLLKTRRQLSPTVYTSLLQSISKVYSTGGILSFWEGGGLRIVRKAGSAGIGWAVYEGVVGLGERRTVKKELEERG
ncbi:hypothetical protein MNV49_006871 [Pseudohyphozyma bogoriensis]|nr:hypothetical protein MNV49_006871 [Pseudohyphozyma bogoriensis]